MGLNPSYQFYSLPLSDDKAKSIFRKIKNCWLKGKENQIKYKRVNRVIWKKSPKQLKGKSLQIKNSESSKNANKRLC